MEPENHAKYCLYVLEKMRKKSDFHHSQKMDISCLVFFFGEAGEEAVMFCFAFPSPFAIPICFCLFLLHNRYKTKNVSFSPPKNIFFSLNQTRKRADKLREAEKKMENGKKVDIPVKKKRFLLTSLLCVCVCFCVCVASIFGPTFAGIFRG